MAPSAPKKAPAAASSGKAASTDDAPVSVAVRSLQLIGCILAAVCLYVYMSPSPIEPVAFTLPTPVAYPNTAPDLAKAQLSWKGRMTKGPESITFDTEGKYAYFGNSDGKIVRAPVASPFSAPEPMAVIGDPNRALPFPCGTYETQGICGRPLGLTYHPNGFVVVADAYHGLVILDPKTRQLHRLCSTIRDPRTRKTEELKFINSAVVADDGKIYFTVSSRRFALKDYMLSLLDGSLDGGVGVFDPSTSRSSSSSSGEATWLTKPDSISFANGIVMAPGGDAVLVAELTRARVVRVPLSGHHKGAVQPYLSNLPTLPDNLSWADPPSASPTDGSGQEKGVLLISGTTLRAPGSFSPYDLLASRPWARKLVAKAVPRKYLSLFAGGAAVVAVADVGEKGGTITQVMFDKSGRIHHVSEAAYRDGILYLGSFSSEATAVGRLAWSPSRREASTPTVGLPGAQGEGKSKEELRKMRTERAEGKMQRRKEAAEAEARAAAALYADEDEKEEL